MGVQGGAAAIDNIPDNIDTLPWTKENILNTQTNQEPLILDLTHDSGSFRGAIIDGLLVLYHKKLLSALFDFGVNNIQYYPVILRNQNTGQTEENYYLINILTTIDCVDLKKSKIKWWSSGMGYDFISMVIDETKTNGLSIFRLKDDPTKVLISEHLKNYIEKNKVMVGVNLIESKDYSDF